MYNLLQFNIHTSLESMYKIFCDDKSTLYYTLGDHQPRAITCMEEEVGGGGCTVYYTEL